MTEKILIYLNPDESEVIIFKVVTPRTWEP